VKSRPMLMMPFSMEGIIAGRKNQTRRVEKKQPNPEWEFNCMGIPKTLDGREHPHAGRHGAFFKEFWNSDHEIFESRFIPSPYGGPGDELRFKETYCLHVRYDHLSPKKCAEIHSVLHDLVGGVKYMVDVKFKESSMGRTRSSLFMPNEFIRERRILTGIRFERVQSISKQDAIDEGLVQLSKDHRITLKYGIPDSDGLPGNDNRGWPWLDWEVDPVKAYAKWWDAINAKPKPVKAKGKITHYVSYPWDEVEDPIREYRGKKWVVFGNCWVWVLRWKN